MRHAHRLLATPVGRLRLVADEAALIAVLWPLERPGRVALPEATLSRSHPVLGVAAEQLEAWFAGSRRMFELPLGFPRATAFQRRVWSGLCSLGFGTTTTYGELAAKLGCPAAARAVGAAVGRNPLSIVLPCHRVLGRGGRLTGFAGGLAIKRQLLAHEHGGRAFPRTAPLAGPLTPQSAAIVAEPQAIMPPSMVTLAPLM